MITLEEGLIICPQACQSLTMTHIRCYFLYSEKASVSYQFITWGWIEEEKEDLNDKATFQFRMWCWLFPHNMAAGHNTVA